MSNKALRMACSVIFVSVTAFPTVSVAPVPLGTVRPLRPLFRPVSPPSTRHAPPALEPLPHLRPPDGGRRCLPGGQRGPRGTAGARSSSADSRRGTTGSTASVVSFGQGCAEVRGAPYERAGVQSGVQPLAGCYGAEAPLEEKRDVKLGHLSEGGRQCSGGCATSLGG